MSNLYENIKTLCDNNGVKPSKMCGEIGISKGLMTDLKMGRKSDVTGATAVKIADYFGASTDEVLRGAEKERAAAPKSDGLSPEDARIMDLLRRLSPENKRKFAEILEALAEPPTQAPDDQA
mgnify:CR=1 FL=1